MVEDGTQICVKGFLVGATKQSMSNAEFSAPFASTTSVLLANRQANGDTEQFKDTELFPICLTDCKKAIRTAFNLQDQPQYWNKYAYIVGTLNTYLSQMGLREVQSIEIDDSHVVTEDTNENDNENDNPDDNENQNDNDNENQNDNDNENQNDNDNENPNTGGGSGGDESLGDKIYSVAEAKNIPAQTRVIVEAYIVASTADKMENCEFEAPFNFSNYIVLADNYDNDKEPSAQYDLQTYTDLYPVHLGAKGESLRNNYNLVDHPELHNKKVRITGNSVYQLKTMGLYEVEEIIITP